MVLFQIPDIRLFWSDDERFTSQFSAGKIVKFNSYSKYPLCYKDVSFWLPETGLHPNDVYEVRGGVPLSITVTLKSNPSLSPPDSAASFSFFSSLQLIRNETGDIVERVELLDQFTNKKNGKESHAYRWVNGECRVKCLSSPP